MTIIASWGGPHPVNSYIGLTEANSLITTTFIDPADWTSSTSIKQAAALIEATRHIDSRQYIGGRYYFDQQLEFPRVLSLTFPWNRTSVSSTVYDVQMGRMQRAVETATCMQALWLLRQSGRNLHAERISMGIKGFTETVGPLTEKVEYRGKSSEPLTYEAIKVLAPWLTTKRAFRA